MKRYLSFIILSVFLCGCHTNPGPLQYNESLPIVRIYSANGVGTGTIVGEHYILSAWHVFENQVDNTYVNKCEIKFAKFDKSFSSIDFNHSYKGTVYLKDKKRDLVLIRVNEKLKHAINIGSVVNIGDEIYHASFRYNGVFLSKGYIVGKMKGSKHRYKLITTDVNVVHGSSGGPLVNKDGELVGIAQWLCKSNPSLSGGIHIDEIRKFLMYASSAKILK